MGRRRGLRPLAHYAVGVSDTVTVDRWRYTARWPVRQYELDQFGHVNNAVYLNWIEQVATDHVEALGFGRDWAARHGGAWVVREHHVTYHRPVRYGEVVLVTTLPQRLDGVRGLRRTEIHRESDGTLLMEADTVWVWVDVAGGRPRRIPADLLRFFERRRPSGLRRDGDEQADPEDDGDDE